MSINSVKFNLITQHNILWGGSLGSGPLCFRVVQQSFDFTVGAFSHYKCQAQVDFTTRANHLELSSSSVPVLKK